MSGETRCAEFESAASFAARDARLLLAFCRVAAPAFPSIAEEFCERVREHFAARQADVDEAQLRSLGLSLVSWLEGVFGGYDDNGVCERPRQRVHTQLPFGLS